MVKYLTNINIVVVNEFAEHGRACEEPRKLLGGGVCPTVDDCTDDGDII